MSPICFEKKKTVGRIIAPFFFESSESDRVFISLHESNSIFRAQGINSEWVSARIVRASGSLPWIGVDDPSDVQRLQAQHAGRLQESANFQLGGPGKLTGADDLRHVLQTNGGLTDLWYVDDGDILWPTSPTPKSERSGTHRRQKSFAM